MFHESVIADLLRQTDDDLPYAFADAAEVHLFGGVEGWADGVDRMSPEYRPGYSCTYLAMQMHKAGFHCFFTNSRGRLDGYLEDDLRAIRALDYVEVFRKAFAIYKSFDYALQWQNIGKSWDIYQEGFRDKRFENVEAEYDAVSVPLERFISVYLRSRLTSK